MSFSVHKIEKFSSNPGKVHFEVLVHLLIYSRENKTLVLEYYDDIKYTPLFILLRKFSTKTENQLMTISHFSCQYFPNTSIITGAYIIFYQGGTIDHGTHVPGPVYQSSAESDYNVAYTLGMSLSHFRMLINEFLTKDTDIVP